MHPLVGRRSAERHGPHWSRGAEPDVDELVVDEQRHVRFGSRRRAVLHPVAAEATRHRESESFQHRREQRVLLEAVPTAAPVDELRDQAVDVEPNLSSEGDVEVLERDRSNMSAMEFRQRGVSTIQADPSEIPLDHVRRQDA